MDKAYILTLLQRPIAFHRVFVPIAGVTGALFLSQLLYWSDRGRESGGWIYKTQAEWSDETGLTRYEQEFARKNLRKSGILEERYAGIPARLYYRVNFDALGAYLENECAAKSAAISRGSDQSDKKKVASMFSPNKEVAEPHPVGGKTAGREVADLPSTNTETTSEISSESTAVAAVTNSTCCTNPIDQTAAASSIETQIETAKKNGVVIENDEDKLLVGDLISEYGIESVLEQVQLIRTVDHRRAYASTLRKKLTAVVALQKNESVRKHVSTIDMDEQTKSKGNSVFADIERKRLARKSSNSKSSI